MVLGGHGPPAVSAVSGCDKAINRYTAAHFNGAPKLGDADKVSSQSCPRRG